MSKTEQDVIIIGGGISGVAAAYELARAGVSVTLLEKGELGSMASGWTLGGVRQSGRHPAELPLARAAVARWQRLDEELETETEYRQGGNLRLACTPEGVTQIEAMVAEQQAMGLDLTFLPTNKAVREVAPALSENILAASYCPSDGHANPNATVGGFARAAKDAGAVIQTHTEVTAINQSKGRVTGVTTRKEAYGADIVVVAANLHSDALCNSVGISVPVHGEHVSVIQTTPLPPLLDQVLGISDASFAGRQEVGGRLRLTSGVTAWQRPEGKIQPEQIQPPLKVIADGIDLATALIPAVANARANKMWGGIVTMTPDGLPVIERSQTMDGLIIAAGFSGHGFCLGPITGQIIRDLVMGKETGFDLDPFRQERFGAGETANIELFG